MIKLETMERVCGALSNKVDPNVSPRGIENYVAHGERDLYYEVADIV